MNNWIFSSLVNLFLPRICSGCGQQLSKGEEVVCVRCLAMLPETEFYDHAENPTAQGFYGRFPFEYAAACYYFQKSSIIQSIVHEFKYKNKKKTALFMGRQMGMLLKDAAAFQLPDVIVPVPLYPRKFKQRGYNQSTLLGNGIAEICDLPVETNLLHRKVQTQTQTKLNAIQRWENVKNAFTLSQEKKNHSYRHYLLIDDVITSGATLEACARQLAQLGKVKISMLTLAKADF